MHGTQGPDNPGVATTSPNDFTNGLSVESTNTARANLASITATDPDTGAPTTFLSRVYTILAGPALGGLGNLAVSWNSAATKFYISALRPGIAWLHMRFMALTFEWAPANTTALTLSATTLTLANGVALKLGNTYTAGALIVTGSLEVTDQAGNVYLLPVQLKP